MPCFSSGPTPGTQEYEDWLPQVQKRLDSFIHVVDYYYHKAGLSLPQPHTIDGLREWLRGGKLPPPHDAIKPVDLDKNTQVLRQILLHLQCDGVDVFQLNDIANLFSEKISTKEITPKQLGYCYVLNYCFSAMRNDNI